MVRREAGRGGGRGRAERRGAKAKSRGRRKRGPEEARKSVKEKTRGGKGRNLVARNLSLSLSLVVTNIPRAAVRYKAAARMTDTPLA